MVIVQALSGGVWVQAIPWEAWDAPVADSAVVAVFPVEDLVALAAVASAAAELLDLGKKLVIKKPPLFEVAF